MKKKKKISIIAAAVLLVAAVAAVVLLRMKGNDKEPVEEPDPVIPAPILYEIKDFASVVALPVGESVTVTEETQKKIEKKEAPQDDEETSKDEEKNQEDQDKEKTKSKKSKKSKKDKKKEQDTESVEEQELEETSAADQPIEKTGPDMTVSVIYHYAGLPAPMERIQDYCQLLTAEDFGFVPVDEKIMAAKMPDLEAPEGMVNLVHPVGEGEEESLFSLQIAWQADETFSVTVARIAGGIVMPPQPRPMTLEEAEDFFYQSDPALFGLSGESMEEYEIYALDGAVLVGTIPCMRMNVYEKDEVTGTNQIAGQYLLANTGLQLYWVGTDGEIREIPH